MVIVKDNINSLAYTMYNCKYQTVGKNTNKIKEYIKNQLKEDEQTKKDY